MYWLGAVPSSEVRIQFGVRLKSLRLSAGFRTARAFAEALALDENRYTRYERGEVEPNLATICRICSVLAIQPNDLFCFAHEAAEQKDSPDENRRAAPVAQVRLEASRTCLPTSNPASIGGHHLAAVWEGGGDLVAALRAVAEIYPSLKTADPGRVVAEILGATGGLDQSRKEELVNLVGDFMRKPREF
jgi:transcriptional regulator with XRE-family HTH domain